MYQNAQNLYEEIKKESAIAINTAEETLKSAKAVYAEVSTTLTEKENSSIAQKKTGEENVNKAYETKKAKVNNASIVASDYDRSVSSHLVLVSNYNTAVKKIGDYKAETSVLCAVRDASYTFDNDTLNEAKNVASRTVKRSEEKIKAQQKKEDAEKKKNDAVKAYDDCVSTTQYDASTAKAIFDYYKTRSGLASESVDAGKGVSDRTKELLNKVNNEIDKFEGNWEIEIRILLLLIKCVILRKRQLDMYGII